MVRSAPFKFGLLLQVDFNICDSGRERALAPQIAPGTRGPAIGQSRPGDAAWRALWRQLTEISSNRPTCWHQGTKSAACVGRSFTATPPWLLCQGWQEVQSHAEPEELHLGGVSDHSPVSLVFSDRAPPRSDRPRPLPLRLYSDPVYADMVKAYEAQIDFDLCDPPEQLRLAVLCRQLAGAATRDLQLEQQPHRLESRAMVARSIARAVYRQDARMARALRAHHPWTRVVLLVSAGGEVSLADPAKFNAMHAGLQQQEARRRKERLEKEAEDAICPGRRQRALGRKSAAGRRAQLWNPFRRRKFLACVTSATEGSGATEPSAVGPAGNLEALTQYWRPVFEECSPVPRVAE